MIVSVQHYSTANIDRRHLKESQRGLIGARLAQLPRGGDRRSAAFKAPNGGLKLSAEQAAKMCNVSERSIEPVLRRALVSYWGRLIRAEDGRPKTVTTVTVMSWFHRHATAWTTASSPALSTNRRPAGANVSS
jgi:hypothetical protein